MIPAAPRSIRRIRGDKRELVTWIWYPAAAATAAEPADYLPAGWESVDQLLGVDSAAARCHAVVDAPVSDGRPSYPVVLFSPSGFPPLMWAAIAEELASHGYVVVGVNHTYETPVTVFTDGRVVPANPAAIAGVLGPQQGPHESAFRPVPPCASTRQPISDPLPIGWRPAAQVRVRRTARSRTAGRVRPLLRWQRRTGVVSHDVRCRAAANLDGALWSEVGSHGVDRPVLQILADHHEFDLPPDEAVAAGMAPDRDWFLAEKSIAFDGWRTIDRTARPGYTAQVRGATHVSFMDVPFLPLRPDAPISGLLAATSIDAGTMWRIVTQLLLAFFGETIDGTAGPTVDEVAGRYSAVTVGAP